MTANLKLPPPRNLNIYRLVVARGLKQAEVACLFNVTPVRICQVVRRVRRWVDLSIGDWLFPRRDDLRFYAALEAEQIRVHELENDPENVLIAGPGWTYRRQVESGALKRAPATRASQDVNQPASLSADPLKSFPKSAGGHIGATSSGDSDFDDPHIHDLAHRLAELLIVWKKSQKLSAALKSR